MQLLARVRVIVVGLMLLATTVTGFYVVRRPAAEHAASMAPAAIAAPRLPDLPAPIPPRALEARVVHAGRPVADVEVRISDGSAPTSATARTDATGVARFEHPGDGPFELWAVAPELASPLVRVPDVGGAPVELALEPATTLRGEVQGAGGAPVTIELAPIDLDHAVRTAIVDARGGFAIDGLPAGHWRLAATSPGLRQTSARELVVPADRVVVTLEPAGELAGTVVDREGAPVAGATIVVRRQGAKGLHPVEWSAPGMRWLYPFATHRQLPSNESARFGAARLGTRLAECGAGHCGIDLVMPRGTVVHAVADGTVTVATSALASEAGRFVAIDHGDGLVTMYMHLDHVRDGLQVGQTIRAGTALGTVGSTGFDPTRAVPHLHFALTQHRGGRTWYLDPEPSLRHAVPLPAPRALDEPVEIATPRLATVITRPSDEITTDARGRFRVPELDPGSYVAVAFASGFAPGASTPVEVQGRADGVVVTLAPGLTVRGRVLGRSGPLAGATILASTGFGETSSKLASTTTDDHGEFVFRALAGTITLATTAPGYGEASRTLELAGHDARVDLALVLALVAEDARLRGVVRSPFGPVAGATVRIVEGPTQRGTTTDAAGEFTMSVATGHYVLDVSAPELPPRRIALDSDHTADIRLEQGGRARLTIVDARDGTALAGVRIDARGPGTITRTSDARGSIDLPGLAAGTWTIAVRGPGHAPLTRTLEIRPSRIPVEVRLELARAATVGGVVRDRRGTRIAGARVSAGDAETRSDADGNYRLLGVATGRAVLEVSLGDRHGAVSLELAAGDERRSVDLELSD